MPSSGRATPRGQALVMFAMFMLVLVFLVMATLSLSRLTHQKMQMQIASDTAAYSQAVATARAYNSVALLNRAQVATMVALTGVDSAISFAGSYRAALNATWYGYVAEFDQEYCGGSQGSFSTPRRLCEGTFNAGTTRCSRVRVRFDIWGFLTGGSLFECSGVSCEALMNIFGILFFTRAVEEGASLDASAILNRLAESNDNARLVMIRKELTRVKGIWQQLDGEAGQQARNIQSEAASYSGLQATAMAEARAALAPMSHRSVSATKATINAASLSVADGEFGRGFAGGVTDNSIDAAMGSRAHTFITRREDGQRAIEARLRKVLEPSPGSANEVTVDTLRGNGYFANNRNHGARPATAYAAWGDEESRVFVNYQGPGAGAGSPGTVTGNLRFEGWVGSTDLQNTTDQHDWCPKDPDPDADPPDVRHTMLPHAEPPAGFFDPCASTSCIWPNFFDTNAGLVADRGDAFGQPKLFASATTDLTAHKDPWNFLSNYRFSASSGAGARTDFRARHPVQGVDQSLQSVSAAMAYYHRPGHWREPPNLFNPYWRATLVRANIDDPGLADVRGSVSAGNSDAIGQLVGAGYQGIP